MSRVIKLNGIPRERILWAIDEYIVGRHAERDRQIMRRRLYDGICLEPLAEEFGLSVQHIKRICYRRECEIYSHL